MIGRPHIAFSAHLLGIAALALLGSSGPTQAAEFYIAPSGSDASSGTKERPFATLEAARDAIRAFKKRTPTAKEAVTVWLAGGTYHRTQSFTLEQSDSGTAAFPVTYRAQPGASVVLSGAQSLPRTAWSHVTDDAILRRIISPEARTDLLQLDLKANGITDFGTLTRHGFALGSGTPPLEFYVDGERQKRARWPNVDTVRMGKIEDKGASQGEADFKTRGGSFRVDFDRLKYWTQAKDVWLDGVLSWDWVWSYNKIAKLDSAQNILTLGSGEVNGLIAANKDFFFVENLLEEIDEPGESYLDRDTGILYWLPTPNNNSPGVTFTVSVLKDPLIRLTNASFVNFENLSFDTGRNIALQCQNGRDIHVRKCAIRNFGNGAMTFQGQHNSVEDCEITEVGNTAISLDGGDKDTLTAGENSVENCRITSWGYWQKVYNPAVDLRGVGNRVSHCVMADAPHCAIQFNGNNHLIENNEFHHVLRSFKDMGVIYSNLGMSPLSRGTIVRNNYFHDIGQEQDKLVGVYPDNGTMGMLIEGNIFAHFGSPQNQHVRAIGGNGFAHIIARNNIFVDCVKPYELTFFLNSWSKSDVPAYEKKWHDALATVDLNNGPYARQYPELTHFFQEDRITPDTNSFEGNVIFNPTLPRVSDTALTVNDGPKEKVHAQDNLVTNTDPGFVDWAHQNFTIRPNAPLFQEIPGFKPLLMNDIGLDGPVGPDTAQPATATEFAPPILPGAGQLGYFAEKVRHGDTVRIGAIGGSITMGTGASSAGNSYFWTFANKFGAEIKQRGAKPEFSWAPAGGTDSVYGAYRAGAQLLKPDLDLLLIEFAVNDSSNLEALDGVEGIVRQALKLNPKMAIVLLYTSTARYEQNFYSHGLQPPATVIHHRVANFYNLAEIDLGPLVDHALKANRFTSEAFWPDGTHPSDTGHAFYAQALIQALTQTLTEPAPQRPISLAASLGNGKLEYARMEALSPNEPPKGWAVAEHDWFGVKTWKSETPNTPIAFTAKDKLVGLLFHGNLRLRWSAPGQPEQTVDWQEGTRRPSPAHFQFAPTPLASGTTMTAEALPDAEGKCHAEIFGITTLTSLVSQK